MTDLKKWPHETVELFTLITKEFVEKSYQRGWQKITYRREEKDNEVADLETFLEKGFSFAQK